MVSKTKTPPAIASKISCLVKTAIEANAPPKAWGTRITHKNFRWDASYTQGKLKGEPAGEEANTDKCPALGYKGRLGSLRV
jgi:hypothetical protein